MDWDQTAPHCAVWNLVHAVCYRGDWKCRLMHFSLYHLINFNWFANSMDPDQRAPHGAVWSWSTLFAIEATENVLCCNFSLYHQINFNWYAKSMDPIEEQSDLGPHCFKILQQMTKQTTIVINDTQSVKAKLAPSMHTIILCTLALWSGTMACILAITVCLSAVVGIFAWADSDTTCGGRCSCTDANL